MLDVLQEGTKAVGEEIERLVLGDVPSMDTSAPVGFDPANLTIVDPELYVGPAADLQTTDFGSLPFEGTLKLVAEAVPESEVVTPEYRPAFDGAIEELRAIPHEKLALAA